MHFRSRFGAFGLTLATWALPTQAQYVGKVLYQLNLPPPAQNAPGVSSYYEPTFGGQTVGSDLSNNPFLWLSDGTAVPLSPTPGFTNPTNTSARGTDGVHQVGSISATFNSVNTT